MIDREKMRALFGGGSRESAPKKAPGGEAQLWRSSGWDRAILAELVEGLEEGLRVQCPETHHEVVISYAADQGHTDARDLLKLMQSVKASTLDELFLRGRVPSGSEGAGRLMWTYVVRNRHDSGRVLLEDAGYRFPRSLLEEDEAYEARGEYIYLMVEEGTHPPICKIGRTSKPPPDRERELNSSTSQHRRIRLVRYWTVEDCRHAEATIFEALAEYRVNERREFFQIHPADAGSLIDELLRY